MKFAALRGNYNGRLSCILQWAQITWPMSWATFLHGEPRKSSPMGFYVKTFLAKCLSALSRRNSPEGHHFYWFNTMKPINLPPQPVYRTHDYSRLLCHFNCVTDRRKFSDIITSHHRYTDKYPGSESAHVSPIDSITDVLAGSFLPPLKKAGQ